MRKVIHVLMQLMIIVVIGVYEGKIWFHIDSDDGATFYSHLEERFVSKESPSFVLYKYVIMILLLM